MSDDADVQANGRIDEFREDVAGLRVPTPSAQAERRLLYVGAALAVAGVVAIFVGWWGASGTGVVADQIPYVISGGLLGVGLCVFGSVLFLRYSLARLARFWLVRSLHEQRVQTDRVVAALERVEAALRELQRERTDA